MISNSIPPTPLFSVPVLISLSCLLAERLKISPGSACYASYHHSTHKFITPEREKNLREQTQGSLTQIKRITAPLLLPLSLLAPLSHFH